MVVQRHRMAVAAIAEHAVAARTCHMSSLMPKRQLLCKVHAALGLVVHLRRLRDALHDQRVQARSLCGARFDSRCWNDVRRRACTVTR